MSLQVYAGRWSEVEMSGSGIEELAPLRMVAAESADLAIQILGCTPAWFSALFNVVAEDKTAEFAFARPGTVFESYIELERVGSGFDRKVQWVPLDEMPAFRKEMSQKLLTQAQEPITGRNPEITYNPFLVADPEVVA